jgi:hypothetical protein
VVGAFEEAQGDELAPEGAVVGDPRGLVPVFELRLRLEARLLGADRGREAITAGGFVGEDEGEEVLVGHLLLTCQDESLGKRVEHTAELEALERGLEIGDDGVWGHASSPCFGRVSGRVY